MKELKVVVVGDGGVDKTVTLISYAEGKFPKEYIPTVFDNYEVTKIVDNEEIKFELWDTAGQEGYARIRTISYPKTDVFLILFSVVNHPSFCNVEKRWYPEIKYHCPHTPIILVGNKIHLRDDPDVLQSLAKENKKPVTAKEAESMAKRIGAITYVECSALTRKGLKNVFDTAFSVALGTFQKFTISPPKIQSSIALTAEIDRQDTDSIVLTRQQVAARDVFAANFAKRQEALLAELDELGDPRHPEILALYLELHQAERCLGELANGKPAPAELTSDKYLNVFALKRPYDYVDWTRYNTYRLKQKKLHNKSSVFKDLLGLASRAESTSRAVKVRSGKLNQETVDVLKPALLSLARCYRRYINFLCDGVLSDDGLKYLMKPPTIVLGLPGGDGWLIHEADKALFSNKAKTNTRGTATVKSYAGVHYKLKPHAPGVEFLVGSLSNVALGEGATPTEFFKFLHEGRAYACQASKSVVGEMLEDILKVSPEAIDKIDLDNFSAMIIQSLLIDPQDGKADNYMVEVTREGGEKGNITQLRILGIDNDLAFALPLILGSERGHEIDIHNVLYFFPQMDRPFNDTFKAKLLNQSPLLVVLDWVKLIYQKNQAYNRLRNTGIFSEQEFSGPPKDPLALGLQLPIRFVPGTLSQIYKKLCAISHCFRTYPDITHNELLCLLQPAIYQHYAQLKEKNQGDILQCMVDSYRAGIRDKDELKAFNRRMQQQDITVLTESVMKTNLRGDFERNRNQVLGDALLDLLSKTVDVNAVVEEDALLAKELDSCCQLVLNMSLSELKTNSTQPADTSYSDIISVLPAPSSIPCLPTAGLRRGRGRGRGRGRAGARRPVRSRRGQCSSSRDTVMRPVAGNRPSQTSLPVADTSYSDIISALPAPSSMPCLPTAGLRRGRGRGRAGARRPVRSRRCQCSSSRDTVMRPVAGNRPSQTPPLVTYEVNPLRKIAPTEPESYSTRPRGNDGDLSQYTLSAENADTAALSRAHTCLTDGHAQMQHNQVAQALACYRQGEAILLSLNDTEQTAKFAELLITLRECIEGAEQLLGQSRQLSPG